MKKRGYIGRLAALAMVLCLVTMSLTAGTLAKYTSSATGNATATVAAWKIEFSNNKTGGDKVVYNDTTNIALNLEDAQKVTDKLVAAGKIAPATSGSFDFKVDGSGTEVAFKYTIELNFSGTGLDKAPIKFYSDSTFGTEITMDSNKKVTLSDTVMADATGTAATKTLYWKWDSTNYNSTETNEDKRDTAVGVASAASTLIYTIPVTITAEQLTTVSP